MSGLLVTFGVLILIGTIAVYAKLFDRACQPENPVESIVPALVVLMVGVSLGVIAIASGASS